MGIKAFISGCRGTSLTEEERTFFSQEKPWALILFQRNCENPDQIKNLIHEFKTCIGDANTPVLIDQEGGRVQRLKPPLWQQYHPSSDLGALYQRDPEKGKRASWLQARLIAHDLYSLGITIDCLPVLDVPQEEADLIIGDRAYAKTPEDIIILAREAIAGLKAGGVLPVMKHIPGHGRALCDSHLDLPCVDTKETTLDEVDFAPFKALNDTPLAMTAHIVFSDLDQANPVTHSSHIITHIIRQKIGFHGTLMSDDLSMQALTGTLAERTRKTFEAGCDLALHCNGQMEEMREVADNSPLLSGLALTSTNAALEQLSIPETFDHAAGLAELDELLSALSTA